MKIFLVFLKMFYKYLKQEFTNFLKLRDLWKSLIFFENFLFFTQIDRDPEISRYLMLLLNTPVV